MSEPVAEPAAAPSGRPRLKRVLIWLAGSLALVLAVSAVGGYLIYRHLNGNLSHTAIDIPGKRPPRLPGGAQNILVMGSDTRDFKGGRKFGSEVAGARSDTTIVVHLAADGQHAVLVSIPRDTYAHIPRCKTATGISSPQWNKFNAAFSIGGPSCTIATVEHLTHLHIDHFVEVNFAGFQSMVDALGGVNVCISKPINDPVVKDSAGNYHGSGLVIGAGTHTLKGKTALAFVRARYGVGDGSDLGRIKNQQIFLSSMIRKATSTGLIFHPLSLYRFLNAATKSLNTDPGFGLPQLKSLAGRLHGLRPGRVALLTVPLSNTNAYVNIGGIPASVVYWDKPRAKALWTALAKDQPLPGTEPKPTGSPSPSASPLVVPPSQIHVRVLNGTGQAGLAHKVASDLAARGFVVDAVGDADTSGYTSSIVRYGADRVESSQTLAAAVTGSQRQADGTLGTTLTLIVGSDYSGVQSVTISTPTPTPSASLDVVTANRDRCTA